MPTFEVRNRRSKMVLGEVIVETPEQVIAALLDVTGSSMEDLTASLGGTMEAAVAALDIVEIKPAVAIPEKHQASRPLKRALPVRRRTLYANCYLK